MYFSFQFVVIHIFKSNLDGQEEQGKNYEKSFRKNILDIFSVEIICVLSASREEGILLCLVSLPTDVDIITPTGRHEVNLFRTSLRKIG